jgi:hypothetical protein
LNFLIRHNRYNSGKWGLPDAAVRIWRVCLVEKRKQASRTPYASRRPQCTAFFAGGKQIQLLQSREGKPRRIFALFASPRLSWSVKWRRLGHALFALPLGEVIIKNREHQMEPDE